MSDKSVPDGPPPPYQPPRMSHTLYYFSVGNLAFRFLVFVLGFGAMLVSVFASRGGYNPTLPTAICLPLLAWGITGRPDSVDLHFMRYRNAYQPTTAPGVAVNV